MYCRLRSVRTSEARSHKYPSEATKTTHEGRTRYMPVLGSDILMRLVTPYVHHNTQDDEDDDGDDFERGEPVFYEIEWRLAPTICGECTEAYQVRHMHGHGSS